MHTELWSWPQWAWVTIAVASLLVHMANDGKMREPRKYSAGVDLCSTLIVGFVLWQGGFLR